MPAPDVALLLPDLRGGGAERVCLNLANNFVERGLSVDMVLMQRQGDLLPLLDHRVNVIDLGASRMLGVAQPLIRYLRRARPSSLVVNMWPLTSISVLARAWSRSRTRLVLVEHTTISKSEIRKSPLHFLLLRMSMRMFAPFADARVTVSKGVADDLASITGLRRDLFSTIYNPIVQGVPPSRDALEDRAPSSVPVILNVGTLKAQKDQATLLRAFAILVSELDARLVILGEGELRDELEALAVGLGIADRVTLPGFTSDPSQVYRSASLFVLSSAWEGFGNVVVEALEHGIPVVSTDCPSGPSEILENGRFGTLVPIRDPQALAMAMRDALSQAHDHEALKRRAGDFSVARAADAYLDLLLPGWREEEVHAPLVEAREPSALPPRTMNERKEAE